MNVFQERLLSKRPQFEQHFVNRHPDNWEEFIDILSQLISSDGLGEARRIHGRSPDNTNDMPEWVGGVCRGGTPFGHHHASLHNAPESVSGGHKWMSMERPTPDEIEAYFQAAMFIASRVERRFYEPQCKYPDSNIKYRYERIRGALQYLGHNFTHELIEMAYTLWIRDLDPPINNPPIQECAESVLRYAKEAQRHLDEIAALKTWWNTT